MKVVADFPFALALRRCAALAIFLTLLLPSLARAATLTVPAQYTTIQAAINAASNGDTVLVAAGTYSGPGNRDIDFNGKNLTVTSQAGAGSTIIDCGGYASNDGSGNHRGFYIHRGETNAVISGFTVKNGYETYVSSIPNSGSGGGICIVNTGSGTVTLTNCTVSGNTAQYGGGIFSDNTTTLTNCTVSGNTAQYYGGGIYNENYNNSSSGTITLTNCTVSGNTALYGGGIFNENDNNSGTTTLTNCTVSGNTAQYGGGICNDNYNNSGSGTITLTNCTVSGNTAQYGGGIYNDNYNNSGSGTITLTNCTVSGNTAQYYGGGIYNYNYSGTITLTNCTVSGNTAQQGGGIYNENSSGTITLTNCTVSGNTAQSDGGGIYNYNYSGTITLTNTIIYGDSGGEMVNNTNSTSNAIANYCDIQGGYPGTGNINADPQFVNAAYGNLYLKAGSPCIGKGTATGAPTTDKDGNPRPNPPSMGAYDTNAAANPALPPVLLVHGTFSNAVDAWSSGMSQRLTTEGFTVEAVNFPTEPETLSNETYIELQAKAIGRRVQELEDRTGKRHICMVCHSMGGLAARYYLQHLNLWPVHLDQTRQAGVDKLILLGTPNWGLDSPILDPVATITQAHLNTLPLAADGYDTAAVDTYDNHWSPAIKEMFAEWEPAPNSIGSGSYAYPNGYSLWSWAIGGNHGYQSPMQPASYAFADLFRDRFAVHPLGSDFNAINDVINEFAGSLLNDADKVHLDYYTQQAQQLGVMYPDNAQTAGVDGRLVSPFLKTLNTTPDNSGAKIYLVGGTYPVALQYEKLGLTLPVQGPYTSNLPNDGVVPTDSALGQDPITKTYLYPQATRAIVGVGHIYLTSDPSVINLVVSWLEDKPITSPVHLLWDSASGQASIWNMADAHPDQTCKLYGPYAGWKAIALADSPNGSTRMLWDNANGQISVWNLSDAHPTSTCQIFGPYAGWKGVGLTVGADNAVHILWDSTKGQASLWNLSDAQPDQTCLIYGPYSGWSGVGLSVGANNAVRLLWDNANGQASVWNLTDTHPDQTCLVTGAYAGWAAKSLSIGPDNAVHLLWNNTNGMASVWNLSDPHPDATCLVTASYAGWSALGVSVGTDNAVRMLWDNTGGLASLWNLSDPLPDATCLVYGAYSGWTAVGLSAH